MAKTSERLSAMKVANVKGPGYFADGDNLYFRSAPSGARVRLHAPSILVLPPLDARVAKVEQKKPRQ
jgi:hypothetical protein